MTGVLRFRALSPRSWLGRYSRVPGQTTVFHVRLRAGRWWPLVEWALEDEIGSCAMVDEGDVESLAEAVNAGKAALGARPGGAFLLDEYGRVLVPAHDGERAAVVVVGECTGPLRFENAFTPGAVFDIYDDSELAPGDPWDRPYVGLRYNLSAGGELYFWEQDAEGARRVSPPAQDADLIASLRELRPYGAVRVLVGVGGIVISKVPPLWESRYIGRIDLATWFPKEVLT